MHINTGRSNISQRQLKYLSITFLMAVLFLLSACADVNLDAIPDAKINGKIRFIDAPTSISGLYAVIQLRDTSIADTESELISEISLYDIATPEFPYSLEYDSARILDQHSYAISVRIYETQDSNQEPILRFINNQAYPVVANLDEQQIDIDVNPVTPVDIPPTEIVAIKSMTEGWQSGLSNPQYHIIESDEQYTNLLSGLTLEATPKPDFRSQTLIAIFTGYQNVCSTSAKVTVRQIYNRTDSLDVVVSFTAPAGTCLANIPDSGPYVLAIIDKIAKPTSFFLSI